DTFPLAGQRLGRNLSHTQRLSVGEFRLVRPPDAKAQCSANFFVMGNLKKKRRLKMSKHKRRKRLKANRHKKRTW
ncbi:MAG: AURKAIP1/COX24 domain-containing protein, partial [Opitutaceae bacterium]